MNVSLPPGMKDVELPRRATDGIPFGAGRPIRVDKQTMHVLAKCEVARKQEACPGRGRPTVFRDANELMHSCVEYMEWINTIATLISTLMIGHMYSKEMSVRSSCCDGFIEVDADYQASSNQSYDP